ncbi:MAG TPA: hypothetical protein PLT77_15190 [Burkholderiaceae bacterium]|nr:hypothetical protein [Burkholderiaceae bacterium]
MLSDDVPAFAQFYEREALWPAARLQRRATLVPAIEAYQAGLRGNT